MEDRAEVRAKALRAARVMSVAVLLALGCARSHELPDDASVVLDSPMPQPDTGPDTGICPEITTFVACCDPRVPEACCGNGHTFGFWDAADACCAMCVEGPLA